MEIAVSNTGLQAGHHHHHHLPSLSLIIVIFTRIVRHGLSSNDTIKLTSSALPLSLVLSPLLLVLASLAPVDSDWIPGYMDREGVLRTFPLSNNLQEVQEVKGVQEDSRKKILLRIKLHNTQQNPEVF